MASPGRTLTEDPSPALDATARPARGDAPVPARIGRFTIEGRLGAGGMGTVLLATDPLLDRKVAIKVLRGDDREDARQRFVREAQAMAKVSHDNVIVVHEVGTDDGRVYIAMELIAGGTLTRWQARKGWREIVDVYLRAGRGLHAAHQAGLVHRDFKPDNVLVDGGKVRVTDFGLVAASDAADARGPTLPPELGLTLTRTGSLLGTPRYMAPEQHAGEPVDARADQFAFCVALFEALYGHAPYPGTTFEEISTRVLAGDLVPPPADSEVPAAIRAALLRGLSRAPADRFPSMVELLVVLGEASAVPAASPAARRRLPWIAGGVAALAVVGGVVVVGGSSSEPPALDGRFRQDRRDPARIALDRARMLGTPHVIDADPGVARQRFDRAQALHTEHRYDEAAAGFFDTYEARPLPDFLYNVATAFRSKGREWSDPDGYRMAVVFYQRYLDAKPQATDRATVEAVLRELRSELAKARPAPEPGS